MTTGRKQHYVPRFYCRRFSGRNSVEVYNLKDKKFYTGSCNDICAEGFFYSRDTSLETTYLSELDGRCSKVFNKLSDSEDIEGLTDEEYYTMRFFLTFQNARTAKFKKDFEDLVAVLHNIYYYHFH